MNLALVVRAVFTLALCFTWQVAWLQQPPGGPPSAQELALAERVNQLRDQAHGLARAGRDADSISVLQEARAIERTRRLFSAMATYDLARTYMRLGRELEALEAYKQGIHWDAEREDIQIGRDPWVPYVTDYAILLARQGKHEEAKALSSSLHTPAILNLSTTSELRVEGITIRLSPRKRIYLQWPDVQTVPHILTIPDSGRGTGPST